MPKRRWLISMALSKVKKWLRGITIAEIAIVVGIIALLSGAVVVAVNPAELLREARDVTRSSQLAELKKLVALYEVDGTGELGDAKNIYISLPDPAASPGFRTECGGVAGLSSLPSGWRYRCVHAGSLRNIDGTGWMPLDFKSISSGSPVSKLPVDPVNIAALNLYYSYVPGGSYVLTARLESQKYVKQAATTDGGTDPARIEVGSDLSIWNDALGLLGYWRFDEEGGNFASDASGNNHSGTLFGSVQWVRGKIGNALSFNGNASNYVSLDNGLSLFSGNAFSITAWTYRRLFYSDPRSPALALYGDYMDATTPSSEYSVELNPDGSGVTFHSNDSGTNQSAVLPGAMERGWTHVALVWGGNAGGEELKLYLNGSLASAEPFPHNPFQTLNAYTVGRRTGGANPMNGSIDELRVYGRALSESEILALYSASR